MENAKIVYFVCAINPFQHHGGEYLRARYLIGMLASRYSLVIFIPEASSSICSNEGHWVSRHYKVTYDIENLNVLETAKMAFKVNDHLVGLVTSECRRAAPIAIWADYMYWWPTIQTIRRLTGFSFRTIWGTHNVQSRVTLQQGRCSPKVLVRFVIERAHEILMGKSYDVVCAVSRSDAEFYERILNCRRVEVIPNSIVEPTSVSELYSPESEQRFACVTGNFTAIQNFSGVKWLIEDVLPKVILERPDFQLLIAGRGSERFSGTASNVVTIAKFDSIESIFSISRFSLVPIFLGSGTRFKVLEAMAHSKAFISTKLGVEGIEISPDQHYLNAESARDFSSAILRLWDDSKLRKRISCEAHSVFLQKYSQKVLAKKISEMVG